MTRHRILVWFGVLFVSLLVSASQTQAKVQLNFDSRQHDVSNRVAFMNHEALRMARSFGLKVHTVKVSKRDLEKLNKLSSKGCGCALAPEDGAGCNAKDCVMGFGVNYGSMVTCGAVCALAWTGNPVAIVVCCACLGIGEWIILYCLATCPPFISNNVETTPLKHKLNPSKAARLSVKGANLALTR